MPETATDPVTTDPVTIDVVSDVVCPWCYVGKRHLEAALAQRPDVAVTVRWHPFQLDPTVPPGGLDRQTYMVAKFGSMDKIDAIHARLVEAGRAVGIDFAFEKITRAVNTLDAHRLLRWAGEGGVQAAAKEALMRAYFVEGRDIGDQTVLVDIAGAVGMDNAGAAVSLAGERDVAAVQADIAQAVRVGVSGVPFFIFAQSLAVPGAQAPDVLAAALDKARDTYRVMTA